MGSPWVLCRIRRCQAIGYQIPNKVETFDSDTNNPRPPPHPPGGYEEDPLTKLKVFFKDNELYWGSFEHLYSCCGISRYLGCVIFGIFSQHHYSEIVFLYQPRSIAFPLAHQSVPYKGEKAWFGPKTHIFFGPVARFGVPLLLVKTCFWGFSESTIFRAIKKITPQS